MDFDEFVDEVEPRLRRALTARYGLERGREATAEALAWAWEHRDRLETLHSPLSYLYRVGQSKTRGRRVIGGVLRSDATWMAAGEPRLLDCLRHLTERQRVCVVLIHGYGWTFAEVAELLGVEIPTVQTHMTRAIGVSLVVVVVGLAVGLGIATRNTPVSTSTSANAPRERTVSARRDGITVSFTLDTPTVVQGGNVRGTLTVSTSKPIRGCPGTFYAVVLSSPRTGPQGASSGDPACTRVALTPGVHTFHVSSAALYDSCTQTPPGTPQEPRCGRRPFMPVLPAGSYSLTLEFFLNVFLPVPAALPIRIVMA